MAKEIFISYQNDSRETAMDVVKYLEQNGRTCWVAPRDVDISYAGDIVDAIEKCKVFVLILSQKACSGSVHVLNELEQAYKYLNDGQLIIIPYVIEAIDWTEKNAKEMDYRIARIQKIDATQTTDFDAKLELLNKINKHLGGSIASEEGLVATDKINEIHKASGSGVIKDDQRTSNRYYDTDDKYEKRRLKIEGETILPTEKRIIDNLLDGATNLNGLIVSCMYAHGVMDKYNLDQFQNVIGLCYNDKATFEANYDFKSDKCIFYTQDVETPDFEDNLRRYMKERNIDRFDFMDITMGFLDWKAPFKVVKVLRRFMKPGCKIYVRDIDDGVSFADPDDTHIFSKFATFYSIDSLAGYRHSGRRVYSYFKKIGAKNIQVVKKGIDTADMDYEQKNNMFHSMFGFIPNDFKILYNQDPKPEYKEILDWCDQYYDDLEDRFMSDDFLYNSSYILMTVEM